MIDFKMIKFYFLLLLTALNLKTEGSVNILPAEDENIEYPILVNTRPINRPNSAQLTNRGQRLSSPREENSNLEGQLTASDNDALNTKRQNSQPFYWVPSQNNSDNYRDNASARISQRRFDQGSEDQKEASLQRRISSKDDANLTLTVEQDSPEFEEEILDPEDQFPILEKQKKKPVYGIPVIVRPDQIDINQYQRYSARGNDNEAIYGVPVRSARAGSFSQKQEPPNEELEHELVNEDEEEQSRQSPRNNVYRKRSQSNIASRAKEQDDLEPTEKTETKPEKQDSSEDQPKKQSFWQKHKSKILKGVGVAGSLLAAGAIAGGTAYGVSKLSKSSQQSNSSSPSNSNTTAYAQVESIQQKQVSQATADPKIVAKIAEVEQIYNEASSLVKNSENPNNTGLKLNLEQISKLLNQAKKAVSLKEAQDCYDNAREWLNGIKSMLKIPSNDPEIIAKIKAMKALYEEASSIFNQISSKSPNQATLVKAKDLLSQIKTALDNAMLVYDLKYVLEYEIEIINFKKSLTEIYNDLTKPLDPKIVAKIAEVEQLYNEASSLVKNSENPNNTGLKLNLEAISKLLNQAKKAVSLKEAQDSYDNAIAWLNGIKSMLGMPIDVSDL